jgi:peptidylprolyl isomerase
VLEDPRVQVTGRTDDKPQVIVMAGEAPPGELEVRDLVVGDGPEAPPGATVTTHYIGVSWSTGVQFDASWDRGTPISFPLDGVIAGWRDGIPGMRRGGRRLLVVPPDLAYGDQPPPESGIAAGETLVFVVDLVGVSG